MFSFDSTHATGPVTDALTGLTSRRAWAAELPRELARARRQYYIVSVGLLDVDAFADCNDREGSAGADRLLKAASAAWKAELRSSDLLARYGGDEFAFLLPACLPDDARRVLDRVRLATPDATCSIGTTWWDGYEGVEALLARADRALHTAKASGGNRVIQVPPPATLAPAA
jgi:diguanylate cyclase (GGDEF)-like protein